MVAKYLLVVLTFSTGATKRECVVYRKLERKRRERLLKPRSSRNAKGSCEKRG